VSREDLDLLFRIAERHASQRRFTRMSATGRKQTFKAHKKRGGRSRPLANCPWAQPSAFSVSGVATGASA
jgi:hypothetical protein